MYTLLQIAGVRTFLTKEAPYLVIAFVIAALLYKFRSFALEALAFFVTWYVLSAIGNTVVGLISKPRAPQSDTLA